MKVELFTQSGRISMMETEALSFLETADYSIPIYLALPNSSAQRVHVRPSMNPIHPLPVSVLDGFQYRNVLSGGDIFKILHYGRTNIHTIEKAPCRFSISIDRFGRAIYNIHRFNPSPSISGYTLTAKDTELLLLTRHLGHIVKPASEQFSYYVSYDPDLNDFVMLRTDHIYIPSKLHGISLSFRQRHSLAKGQRIRLDSVMSAQIDALTASVCIETIQNQ